MRSADFELAHMAVFWRESLINLMRLDVKMMQPSRLAFITRMFIFYDPAIVPFASLAPFLLWPGPHCADMESRRLQIHCNHPSDVESWLLEVGCFLAACSPPMLMFIDTCRTIWH